MDAIVNVGVGGRYPQMTDRLIASLARAGWAGSVFSYKDFPHGAESHAENPYAFKLAAIDLAVAAGFSRVLWCDSSIFVTADPGPVFDLMTASRAGLFLFKTGFNCAQSATDAVLGYAGLTRDAAERLPEYGGGCVGFDFSNQTAMEVYVRWKQYAAAGQFKNSRFHAGQSADPRFLFGRQDQTALSLACAEHGVAGDLSGCVCYCHPARSALFVVCGNENCILHQLPGRPA